MAPESYTDGTWDLRTDVWMMGVLLWGLHWYHCDGIVLIGGIAELFSWAKLPWEEVSDNEVIPLIQRRVKLPYPGPLCPQPIYDVMLSCWKLGLFVSIALFLRLCSCAEWHCRSGVTHHGGCHAGAGAACDC